MKIHIGIMHVPYEERKVTLGKVESRLTGPSVYVDTIPPHGPWYNARRILEYAIETNADYVCILPDDCLPCLDFENQLRRVIESNPKEVISLYSNHPRAWEARQNGFSWYTALNGAVQCTMPVGVARDFLAFVDKYHPRASEFPEDTNLDIFCMATRRLIWTTAVSLIDHQNPPSLQGNDNDDYRRPAIPPFEDMSQINWDTNALFVGLRFRTHNALRDLNDQAHTDLDLWRRYYELDRHLPL